MLLGNRENDLSFLVDDVFYFMVEAQSTYNPNMPFRLLQYISTALLQFVESNALYGKKLVKLKVPKLYTVFTGIGREVPEIMRSEQKLSTAFEIFQERPDLEVVVHAYDFNMVKKEVEHYLQDNKVPERFQAFSDHSLFSYALFTNCVDYYYQALGRGHESEKVQTLFKLCELFRERGIFVDLFNDKEVVNVTVLEFSREKELRYVGFEEGIEQGIEKGIKSLIRSMSKFGASREVIMQEVMDNFELTAEEASNYVEEYNQK